MIKKQLFVLSLLISLTCVVNAWWFVPHLINVSIAYENLTPLSHHKINQILGQNPSSLVKDYKKVPVFLLAATYAYRLKHQSGLSPYYSHLTHLIHFINVPIYPKATWRREHLLKTMNVFLAKKAFDSKYNIYTAFQAEIKTLVSSNTSQEEKKLALSMLLDSVSDLHEPMHIANPIVLGVNTQGATTIILQPSIKFAKNALTPHTQHVSVLHELFDATANGVANEATKERLPLEAYIYAQKEAIILDKKYQHNLRLNERLSIIQPKIWMLNDLVYAQRAIAPDQIRFQKVKQKPKFIYGKLYSSKNYQKLVQQITLLQLYLAGHRMADILNAIFDRAHAKVAVVKYVDSVKLNKQIPNFKVYQNSAINYHKKA